MLRARAAAGFLAAAALLGAGAAAAAVVYEGSLSAATGRYFYDERTNTFALSSGLALEAGRFTARATWPLLLQNTTLVTGSATGGIPSGGPLSGAVADSGYGGRGGRRGSMAPGASGNRVPVPASSVPGYELAAGDPVVSISWKALAGPDWIGTIGGSVKAPVADVGDFGTGEWDYGATAAISRGIGARATVGLDGSWWILGDLPDLDFRNPVTGAASFGWLFSDRWAGVLTASGGTGALRGYDAPFAIGASAHRYGDRATWSLAVSAGLTETAPDLSISLGVGVPISGHPPLEPLDRPSHPPD